MQYAMERWTFSPSGRDAGGREGKTILKSPHPIPPLEIGIQGAYYQYFKDNQHSNSGLHIPILDNGKTLNCNESEPVSRLFLR